MASKFYRRLDALSHNKPASFKDIDKAPHPIRLFEKNTIEKDYAECNNTSIKMVVKCLKGYFPVKKLQIESCITMGEQIAHHHNKNYCELVQNLRETF